MVGPVIAPGRSASHAVVTSMFDIDFDVFRQEISHE
jgi:hypothetical protein